MERVTDFISWAPKITADGDCSHETKDTYSLEESEEEIKSLLMKVKEESEKPGLKFNI